MKSLIRWSTALGLAGGILLSSLGADLKALALSAEQVMQRLRSVPVFTLTDQQGAPLVSTPESGQNRSPVAGVFISPQDAQRFLEELKQKNPQLAQNVQISAVSLADAYNLSQQPGRDNNSRLQVAYIPSQQQVDAAKSLLQQQNQNAAQFQGVPIFMARAAGENGAYLTIKQGEQEVIPMFFNREQIQSVLDRLKQSQPQLGNSMQIQVLNLEGVINTLKTSNNEDLNRLYLVPPQETVAFLRALQPEGQQRQGQQPRQRQGQQQGQQRRGQQPQAQPQAQPQRR
jgi:Tic22-like family